MNCHRCAFPISESASWCTVCGADPYLGCDWDATEDLEYDEVGQVVLTGSSVDWDDISLPALRKALLYHCYHGLRAALQMTVATLDRRIAAGETESVEADLVAAVQGDDQVRSAYAQAVTRLLQSQATVGSLSVTCDQVIEAHPEESPIFRGESDVRAITWARQEYAALADDGDPLPVLLTWACLLLARRGDVREVTFESAEHGLSIAYNALALKDEADVHLDEAAAKAAAATTWGLAVYGLRKDYEDGDPQPRVEAEHPKVFDAMFGPRELVLSPRVWRHWLDIGSAPISYLSVHVLPLKQDPVGEAGWHGERKPALDYVERSVFHEVPGREIEAVTFCGLPAVRGQLISQLTWRPERDVFVCYWVRGEQNLYFIAARAASEHEEQLQSVFKAVAALSIEGGPAADQAVAPARSRDASALQRKFEMRHAEMEGECANCSTLHLGRRTCTE